MSHPTHALDVAFNDQDRRFWTISNTNIFRPLRITIHQLENEHYVSIREYYFAKSGLGGPITLRPGETSITLNMIQYVTLALLVVPAIESTQLLEIVAVPRDKALPASNDTSGGYTWPLENQPWPNVVRGVTLRLNEDGDHIPTVEICERFKRLDMSRSRGLAMSKYMERRLALS
ncbi:unnamed protein product [Discula destructiva]